MATKGSTVIYSANVGSQPAVAFVDFDHGNGTANLRSLTNPTELIHSVPEGVTTFPNFRVVVAAAP